MKFAGCIGMGRRCESLPVRERELKFFSQLLPPRKGRSLPVRERGLKFTNCIDPLADQLVAPCAGAWIEIYSSELVKVVSSVGSLCGSVD